MEWKTECDLLLLQEIVVSEPYQYKASTRERGKIWEDITERLNATEAFGNRLGHKRAVRERYALLAKKFKKRKAEEESASGISPEMSETDKLLERFEESDREACENSEQGEKNHGCHRSGNSQGKKKFFKVREKSGNFTLSQGKFTSLKKVREK